MKRKEIALFMTVGTGNNFNTNEEAPVKINIISCHSSVMYEDVVGGISSDTVLGKIVYEYKDKIILETINAAKADIPSGCLIFP